MEAFLFQSGKQDVNIDDDLLSDWRARAIGSENENEHYSPPPASASAEIPLLLGDSEEYIEVYYN